MAGELQGSEPMTARDFHCLYCAASPGRPCVTMGRRPDAILSEIRIYHSQRSMALRNYTNPRIRRCDKCGTNTKWENDGFGGLSCVGIAIFGRPKVIGCNSEFQL